MNRPMTLRRLSLLLALLPALWTGNVWAGDDTKAQARELFNNAVEAHEQQRFSEALQLFEKAYGLSPAYAVLYNIGQVNAALGRPVEAVAAFEKYLAQGSAAISADRQAEVRLELDRQRARIGSLLLRVTPTAATVSIDGKALPATRTAAEPLLLATGDHSVVAFLDGYTTRTREVSVTAKSQFELELTLEPVLPELPPLPPVTPVANPAASTTRVVVTPIQVPVTRQEPTASRSNVGTTQRTIGYVLGGVGLAGAVTGAAIAATAAGYINSSKTAMANAANGADWDAAHSAHDNAIAHNRLGWIIAGAGGAFVVGGIVLIASAPSGEAKSALVLSPWTTPYSFGATARATW